MAKKKVCKQCRYVYESETCPACKSNSIATTWQGRIYFVDVNKSGIAKNMEIKVKGEYAIKVR